MAFTPFNIDISKKDNGKHNKIGAMTIFVPTLKDIIPFVTSDIKKDEKGADVYEDGLPVYESKEANWLQGAILAQVKGQARNKMVPQTATVKEGLKIAETWDELTAEGVRDGSGLALAREFKDAFKDWVSKQGLSEQAAATLVTFVSNRPALQLQVQTTKDKVRARLEAFASDLSEDDLSKFMRPLESVTQACDAVELAADF